ncbi:MAG: DUF1573 domain-containing protein [Fuerstiella sp.]|nr:DUF1573 domain-containing protein [Fuerstiella sp.]
MSGRLQKTDHQAPVWIARLLAVLPLVACSLAGSTLHEASPLNRTGTPTRPLQFARYCFNHGRDPVSHTSKLVSRFRFRNVGANAVQLGKIERSCGCLTPELSHRRLEPGEVGEMNVSVPLAEQTEGFHEFQLTVHYTAPEPRHETLLIKAVFPEPEIHVIPRAMHVSQRGVAGQPITHHFTVFDNRPQPLSVEAVESSSSWIYGSIQSIKDGGRETRIGIEIRSGIPAGTHRLLVHAQTDDPRFPTVVMPVRIQGPERTEPVIVRPTRLRLRTDQTTAGSVQVQVPEHWVISHVDCFPPELLCEWQQTANGERQIVDLALRVSAPPLSSSREGVVTLYANDSTEMVTVTVEILSTRRELRQDREIAQRVDDSGSNQE